MCATAVGEEAPAAGTDSPRPMPNLLNDLDMLARLLLTAVEEERWLDAYLEAAGISQISEDWLQDRGVYLNKAAAQLPELLPAQLARPAAAALRATRWALEREHLLRPSTRAAQRWRRQHGGAVELLASVIAGAPAEAAAEAAASASMATVPTLPPSLRRSLVRLPTCFYGLDLRPADICRLTELFADRYVDPARPLAVVGVRTSGSYTAPLHVAWLRKLGYASVRMFTHRPGRGWLPGDARALAAIATKRGLALVSDDPPNSGGSVARTAQALEALGYPPERIVLLLPLLNERASRPQELRRYPSVLLEWADWDVRRSFQPATLGRDFSELLGARVAMKVISGPDPRTQPRGHASAIVRVQAPGGHGRRYIVRGVGAGYFGGHAAAVASALPEWSPRVLGIRDGLLYAEDERSTPADLRAADASTLARYVATRASALAVDQDYSLRLGPRGSARKLAMDILARGFGRAERLARPLLFEAGKRLLVPARPAVVDGQTGLEHWTRNGPRVIKTGADEGAFASRDLFCFDPVYDLAGIAAGDDDRTEVSAAARTEYERLSGERVDPVRWLLYQLVHIVREVGPAPWSAGNERRLARAVQRYYAEAFFADTPRVERGPVCLVDVDGVLETRGLGFPTLTPASAISLRALARHGYQVALVTGRSVGEVAERCQHYHLQGGVAGYGAVTWDASSRRVCELIDDEDRRVLAVLRQELGGRDGIELDPGYAFTVRAAERRQRGRGPVPQAEVDRLLADPRFAAVRAIRGEFQTDFVTSGIDKGRGVATYVSGLAADGSAPEIAMAVGDSVSDLPMLALARSAYATHNHDLSLRRAGIELMRHPCQLGFRQAVTRFLGHRPGGCPVCRLPAPDRQAALLLAMIGAPEQPGARKLIALLDVAGRLLRDG